MPTVTVTYVDGTTRTYHPQVARFGGIDLQILGDPDHWPELLVPRAQLTRVTVDGHVWVWNRHRPERVAGP